VLDAEKFLSPEAIKSNLVLSSLYLAAYEILKSAIVDNVRDFFALDYDADGKPVLDKQYRDEVSRLHRDLLQASCLWLEKAGAITSDEVEQIGRIRRHRNEVAHELPQLLSERDRNLNLDYFLRLRELLEKIGIWWIRNFETPINPELDNVEIDDKDYPSWAGHCFGLLDFSSPFRPFGRRRRLCWLDCSRYTRLGARKQRRFCICWWSCSGVGFA
jgi:hypothetical protein